MDYRFLTGIDVLITLVLAAGSQRILDNSTNPFIIEHPDDQYVVKNGPATLNCKAQGHPTPVITWYRNGQQVVTANENSSSHLMLLPSGQLIFLRVLHSKTGRSDLGMYHCNATNPETKFNVISRNATLDMAVIRDDFREIPQTREVVVGMETTLTCRPPRGEPDPEVKWRKNGREILSPTASDQRVTVGDGGSLHIRVVQKDDGGSYVCVGFNVAGERESPPARLIIREKPRIISGPQGATVKELSYVTFECKVTGDPLPTVIWKKQGGMIAPERSEILADRSLRLEKVQSSDAGIYVCRTENSMGHQEASAQLTVHTIPKFVKVPRSLTVGVGRRVSFFCEAEGIPLPSVFWNKESGQVFLFPHTDHDRFFVTEDGRLVMRSVQVQDSGLYKCQALNKAGTAFVNATLTVRASDPRLPPIIQHGPQNQTLPVSGRAVLFCYATGNPLPTVMWTRDGKALTRGDPRIALTDSSTLQISDLRRSDSGVYTCEALSEAGETTWSAVISVEATTDPAIVFNRSPQLNAFPGAPTKVTVSDATDTSLRVGWRPNVNVGASPVTSYMLEYFSPDTGEGWTVVSDFLHESHADVTGLQPNTHYVFLIRARNSHGLGPPTPPSTPEKTLGIGVIIPATVLPALDLDLVSEKLTGQIVSNLSATALSSTAVNVTWVTLHNRNYIEGFYVRYRPARSPKDDAGNSPREDYVIDAVHSNAAVTQFVLTDLQKSTWYDISVQPFYRTVKGSTSSTIRVQTLEDGEQKLVNEAWFLATLIGTIGGVLWVSLCLFSIILYRKHRRHKKLNRGAVGDNSKLHDNHQLNPIPKELPYSLGHQLVTTASSLKPCACNQALMSSCCYNESLSDGEYKTNGEHLSANHTYYTLETPTPKMGSNPNPAPSKFVGKPLAPTAPYSAAAATGNRCPDNQAAAGTPDGVFRPIAGLVPEEQETWNNEIDSSQYNSSCEEGLDRLADGNPQPVLFLPPPPSTHPPSDDSSLSTTRVQPPVYNFSSPKNRAAKDHGQAKPSPRERISAQHKAARNYGTTDENQGPRHIPNQRLQPNLGFQASDYAIKPENRRQQLLETSADSDNISAGYYTFIKPS